MRSFLRLFFFSVTMVALSAVGIRPASAFGLLEAGASAVKAISPGTVVTIAAAAGVYHAVQDGPPAAGVQACEVDIERDSGDGDDVCAVIAAPSDCTLANVIAHAYSDKWCAIDHDRKYGAFVFIQDPVPVGSARSRIRNEHPGETTLTEGIVIPGRLPSDGSSQYGQGSGDPLVIAGHRLQYTSECLGQACSNPSDGDWEDHLLAENFWLNQDHYAYQSGRFGDASNSTDTDPVIETAENGEKATINVELGDAQESAFTLSTLSYVQFRHVSIVLKQGAAFEAPSDLETQLSFLHSRIVVDVGNEADHIFRGYAEILFRAMGGTSPVVISIGKATSPQSPFALFEIPRWLLGSYVVMTLKDAIAFEAASLPSGVSLVTWDDAEPLSCSVVSAADASGRMGCRLVQEGEGDVRSVVRLVEYSGDESDGILYTVGEFETLPQSGVISVAQGETVFANDGRRIEIEMPTCPDGQAAPSSLTCGVEHGTFRGFAQDGGWEIECDEGYLATEAGACVLDCSEHSSANGGGTECIVDDGYEWNVDHTAISEECPGDAAPAAAGGGCACADEEREVWEHDGTFSCNRRCSDPELMSRDERGVCTCLEGFRRRSGRCVEIEGEPAGGDIPGGVRAPLRRADAEAPEDGPTDVPFCVGFTCFDSGGELPAVGDGRADGVGSSGCSLAPVAGAAGGAWLIVFLGLGLILSSAKRRLLNGDRGGRDL